MNEFLTVFLLLIVLVLVGAAYVNNRTRSQFSGGFVFSPIPFILINYALIFAYRPLVILYYDAPTLNFAEIDNEKAYQAIQLGLLSLCAILLAFFVDFYRRPFQRTSQRGGMTEIHINRLMWLNLFFFILVVIGIFIYGSALNNTGDRLENPSEYKGFFLFIITQRFHFVLSVLTFYFFLSSQMGRSWRLTTLVCLISAPMLSLFAAGRGATFYLLIAYGVIYVFARPARISWRHVIYIGAAGVFFSFLNFLLSIVRVVISSTGWDWADLLDAVNFRESGDKIEDLFVLASWDYSVFDVFVTIINELNEFTLGATNLQYFLSYVPRIVWPDKPLDQGFMLYVTNKFYGDVFSLNGSTFAGTLAGEGYLNFGFIGILVYSFVFSLVLCRIYGRACRSVGSNSIIIYALAFPFSQQVIRGGLDVMINFGILILIPLWLLSKILRRSSRRRLEYSLQIGNLK
jgi:hypothetical protein